MGSVWVYIETQYTSGLRILDQWIINKLSDLKQTRIYDRRIGLALDRLGKDVAQI